MSLAATEALDMATSAGGAMQSPPRTTNSVSLSADFAEPATVSSYDSVMIWLETRANPSPPIIVRSKAESVQHGASVAELRRLSGLTWDQLAGLMDVSRRSLHHWVSGKPASAEHQTRLQRLLGTLRRLDRGDSSQNRTLLLTPDHTGRLLLDLAQIRAIRGCGCTLGATSGAARFRKDRTECCRARVPYPAGSSGSRPGQTGSAS